MMAVLLATEVDPHGDLGAALQTYILSRPPKGLAVLAVAITDQIWRQTKMKSESV
jgi:hypothetical protein